MKQGNFIDVFFNPQPLGYHMRKSFSKNFPQIGHSFSENFDSPLLGRKNLKNTGFNGRQIITCPGRLHFLGRPCLLSAGI